MSRPDSQGLPDPDFLEYLIERKSAQIKIVPFDQVARLTAEINYATRILNEQERASAETGK